MPKQVGGLSSTSVEGESPEVISWLNSVAEPASGMPVRSANQNAVNKTARQIVLRVVPPKRPI